MLFLNNTRVNAGLNKGEARNTLARAVFFNRLGEMRDRSFENQRYRASGLNLVTAAIILWNTVYLERAINALKLRGEKIDDALLQHFVAAWMGTHQSDRRLCLADQKRLRNGFFRPLRPFSES